MAYEEPKARVFISCGQKKDSEEIEIAHRISERLSELGFDPYIAIDEQSLRGVKENVFGQLETSEYFVFIDFKREKLPDESHRGSLFSHQELSLASYLDLPLIAFQEEGIKREDGLMRFLQANATPFTDRRLLPNVVADTINQREWKADWKNELRLEREVGQFIDLPWLPENVMTRFFHIQVRNIHLRKSAVNCYVYLEQVHDITNRRDIPLETIEFKWAGYVLPNAVIGPRSVRHFDAFCVSHQAPTQLRFSLFTDSSAFVPRINGPGDFRLTYGVLSENFPKAKGNFILHVSNQLDEVRLTREAT